MFKGFRLWVQRRDPSEVCGAYPFFFAFNQTRGADCNFVEKFPSKKKPLLVETTTSRISRTPPGNPDVWEPPDKVSPSMGTLELAQWGTRGP